MLVPPTLFALHVRLPMSFETIMIVMTVAKMDGSMMEVGCALHVMELVLLVLQRSMINVLRVPLGYRK